MKKYFTILVCALMVGVSVFSIPTKAGWDRKYGTCGGAEIWAYCSTGVAGNPSGCAAETSASSTRNLRLTIQYRIQDETNTRSLTTGPIRDFYTFLEVDTVRVSYMYSHHYVDADYTSLYVDAR